MSTTDRPTGTAELVRCLADSGRVRAFFHPRNVGKGAAVRTAIQHAAGDVVVIQDADLEYDPLDIERLLRPILDGEADVVFGSRFANWDSRNGRVHRAANQLLTWLSNRATGLNLTDMETCYKAMRREAAAALTLRENRFGIEPELTAKLSRGRWRIREMPIKYVRRGYRAGKKIGALDGVRAIWCILRYSRWD